MKKLLKWLKKDGRSITWLAKEIGMDAAYLNRCINGHQDLSIKACEGIHKVTDGKITLRDTNPYLAHLYKTYECLKELF